MKESWTPQLERARAVRAGLFVPGNRPERFKKAVDSGADCIVIDLEDSVPCADKEEARENVSNWLATGGPGWIRVNSADSEWFEGDLDALGTGRPLVVMMPKAESPEEIIEVSSRLASGSCVVPLLESPLGVSNAASIGSVQSVARFAFGNGDLSASLGVAHDDWNALAWVRSSIVLSSAVCGISSPLDGAVTQLSDDSLLEVECRRAAALGFSGKMCIHPRQVPIVSELFRPSPDQIEWARAILAGDEQDGARVVAGEMVDAAVVARARRIAAEDTDAR